MSDCNHTGGFIPTGRTYNVAACPECGLTRLEWRLKRIEDELFKPEPPKAPPQKATTTTTATK